MVHFQGDFMFLLSLIVSLTCASNNTGDTSDSGHDFVGNGVDVSTLH